MNSERRVVELQYFTAGEFSAEDCDLVECSGEETLPVPSAEAERRSAVERKDLPGTAAVRIETRIESSVTRRGVHNQLPILVKRHARRFIQCIARIERHDPLIPLTRLERLLPRQRIPSART